MKRISDLMEQMKSKLSFIIKGESIKMAQIDNTYKYIVIFGCLTLGVMLTLSGL